MRHDVRSPHLEIDTELRSCFERKLWFALGRFGNQISRVTVFVDDLNGPRGGIDKRCRIVVRLMHYGDVFVEDADADLGVVMDRAADRIGQSVRRKLNRRQEWRGQLR